MGLLFADYVKPDKRELREAEFYHKLGCKACPLAKLDGNRHPDMQPTGAARPLVYCIGEAPGKDEDNCNEQFVGKSGQLLRPLIPSHLRNRIRWNNVVRTRPPNNRTPERPEIEACRPSIIRDIEQSRPAAIFGFGNVPLHWVCGFSGIKLWRGRRMPVRIGTHTCWYYPMFHPAYLLHERRGRNFDVASDNELVFRLDLKRAFVEVEDLPLPVVHQHDDIYRDTEIIDTYGSEGVRRIKAALAWAAQQPAIGFDYETKRLRPYARDAKLLSVAVATGERAVAFPLDHREARWTAAERADIFEALIWFLQHSGRKIVHNLAFELEWTGVKLDIELVRNSGEWEDTASQAAILDERKGKNKPGCFSLEFLVQQYFGFNLKKLSKLDRNALDDYSVEEVLRYNAPDARYHFHLWHAQQAELEWFGLQEPYRLQLRRVPTAVLTQIKGVPVDQDEVEVLQVKYGERVAEAKHRLLSHPIIAEDFPASAKHAFNPFSQPDCVHLFHKILDRQEVIVRDKYSKEKKFSVEEEILEQIDHPLARMLIELRKANKKKSTYIDPLDVDDEFSVIHPDSLLHTIFNTIFAETGRLSSEDPNLQNFPKRDEEGREVRKSIVAAPGHVIVAFDYGQIEARVIAMASKDRAFCKALWERYDVHQDWAERIAWAYPARIGGKKYLANNAWKVKDSEAHKVMKEFRGDTKNEWTFPLFFGAQLSSVAEYLRIPENVLKPLVNAFWKEFSGVKKWQDEQVKFYKQHGYVEYLTKRRRRAPLSLNQIINSPIQGTTADIVMDAMCRLSETKDWGLQPELNIHDDLTYMRVPENEVDGFIPQVLDHMLDVPFDFVNVPITVEVSIGKNWMPYDGQINPDGVKEVGAFSSDTWFK